MIDVEVGMQVTIVDFGDGNPIFNMGSMRDHIAPNPSSFKTSLASLV